MIFPTYKCFLISRYLEYNYLKYSAYAFVTYFTSNRLRAGGCYWYHYMHIYLVDRQICLFFKDFLAEMQFCAIDVSSWPCKYTVPLIVFLENTMSTNDCVLNPSQGHVSIVKAAGEIRIRVHIIWQLQWNLSHLKHMEYNLDKWFVLKLYIWITKYVEDKGMGVVLRWHFFLMTLKFLSVF